MCVGACPVEALRILGTVLLIVLHGRLSLRRPIAGDATGTARLLLLICLHFEQIPMVCILHGHNKRVDIMFGQAKVLQEILHLVQIVAHIGHLLHELLFFVDEVFWDGLKSVTNGFHGQLLLHLALLLLRSRIRLDVLPAHPVKELAWELLEHLLGEQVRIVAELLKGYKLHDIG